MRNLTVALLAGSAFAARKNQVTTAPDGYTELPGKCTGTWIENWADGHDAHHGEDPDVAGVDDCADICDDHPECAGFDVTEGKCSHWRSGQISATPHAGHTCFMKEGSGHSAPVSNSCDDVPGYAVSLGKCTGHWIEYWSDGHSAHYGEDHHISNIADCADTCDEHSECVGFYTKQGRCSHWRSGSLSASPTPGHCCYSKTSSALLETWVDLEAEEAADEDGEEENTSSSRRRSRHRSRMGRMGRTGLMGRMGRLGRLGRHHHGGGITIHLSVPVSDSCDDVPGYAVSTGKCTGYWIEYWSDGDSAHYGEDHQISNLADCADTCSEHSECVGFYTLQGKCSHWRSGSLSATPIPGHCCYTKWR